MSYFSKRENTVQLTNKEKWIRLLDEFYHNSKLSHTKYAENGGNILLKRKCLPGFTIIQMQSYFPFNLEWKSRTKQAIFGMHFMLKGHLDYSIGQMQLSSKAGENNILAIPKQWEHALLFAANTHYAYRSYSLQEDYLGYLVNRHPEMLEQLYKGYRKGSFTCLQRSNLINTGEILLIISQLDHAFEMGSTKSVYMEAKILELLALQLRSCNAFDKTSGKLKAVDLKKIRQAEYYLIRDMNSRPSLPRLSRLVGLNTKKLKLGFKEVFGNTVYSHQLAYRMNHAKHLLQNSELSIFEVGLACGYEHSSHFCTTFKRKFGITPSGFRKKH